MGWEIEERLNQEGRVIYAGDMMIIILLQYIRRIPENELGKTFPVSEMQWGDGFSPPPPLHILKKLEA